MLKRLGVLTLLAGACGMGLIPQTAFAQDGYYRSRGYGYQERDRNWNRHERREWREQERRNQDWRAHEWREGRSYDREWRYRGQPAYNSYYYGNYPATRYQDPYCYR